MGKFKFGKTESKFGSVNLKFGFRPSAEVMVAVCNVLINNKKSSKCVKASETFYWAIKRVIKWYAFF